MSKEYIIGRNPVIESLKTERNIYKIWISNRDLRGAIKKVVDLAKEAGIEIEAVDEDRLDIMSEKGKHQGVIAEVEPYKYSTILDIIEYAELKNQSPFVVILDELQDPHNLGAIIRTAEAAGVHGIIIPERRAADITPTVYSTSTGAVEYMRIAKVTNINQAIKELKDRGLWIYGADMSGDLYYKTDLKGSVALVIGNEGKGISRLVKENCDFLVSIPMLGNIESLNASNAASILIYEVVRQNYG